MLHLIRVRLYTWLESDSFHIFLFDFVQIDSNQILYLIRIMSLPDSNQSYKVAQITRKMGQILYVSYSTPLAHLIEIMKYP